MDTKTTKTMHFINCGVVKRDVTNADSTVDVPRGVAPCGEQQTTADLPADDSDVVLFDARNQQIRPLLTRMTVAEALDDSLGPRR